MKNQNLKNLLLNATIPILLSLILFFPSKVLANSDDSIVPVVGKQTIIDVLVDIIVFLSIYFIISAFFLLIGCLIIKQGSLIKSWKFLKHTFLTAIGAFLFGIAIYTLGASIFNNYLNYSTKVLVEKFWILIEFFILFLILFGYNYYLSRELFNLTRKQAISIGVIMGIFTNICLIVYVYTLIF